MKRIAPPLLTPFRLRAAALAAAVAVAAALVACQSILGINGNRPLVPADSGVLVVDDGGADDGTADATGAADVQAIDVYDGNVGLADAADAGAADTGIVYTFANPLQVDVSSILSVNTIVTTADGGIALTWMDGANTDDENDFPTASEMKALGQAVDYGLPDNAFFSAIETYVPTVQLAWTNANNLNPNSLVVSSVAGTSFTFTLPKGQYTQVQLYATGAAGASTLNYTLLYSDDADAGGVPGSLAIPDWCVGTPSDGEFILASVQRVEFGTTFNNLQNGLVCHIYALDLSPDPERKLLSVTFQDQVVTSGSTANLVFYGATAWQD